MSDNNNIKNNYNNNNNTKNNNINNNINNNTTDIIYTQHELNRLASIQAINMAIDLDESDESETSWQKVNSSSAKRVRKNLEANNSKRPNIEHSNSFQLLSAEEEDNTPSTSKPILEEKPPPVFIPGVKNIKDMVNEFNINITRDNYNYKCLRDGQIKVNTKDTTSYRNLIKYLDAKKYVYHTYQIKKDRAYRVVMKNLHFSTPIEDIKEELLTYGHDARYITNVRSRIDKTPLSIFFIDLEPKNNNKDIYDIKYINNAVIKIEPPKHFNEIVQCYRCQEFGHTKSYCKKPYKCVKCGMNHPTAECKKLPDTPPQCTHCLNNHTANYRGCQVYQQLINNKKSRQNPIAAERSFSRTTHKFTAQGATYARVVRNDNNNNNLNNDSGNNDSNNNNNFSNGISQNLDNFLNKLEILMNKQMDQSNVIINMLSTLTTIMNKLCK